MYPYLLPEIFGKTIPMYGIMTALGYLAAILYCLHYKQRLGLKKEQLLDIIFYLILGALIGGKLFFMLLNWDSFNASSLIEKLRYGFVFFGGLIGAAAAGFWAVRKNHIPFFKAADFFAPAVALGHSLGRLGCFFAGCCYGKEAPEALGVHFTNPDSLVPAHLHGHTLYPVQLIESVLVFGLFLVLNKLSQKSRKRGTLSAVYVLGYCLIRFFTELLRADDRGAFVAGMSPSQIISLLLAGAITIFLIKRTYAKKTNDNI